MISGKAISRALGGQFLIEAALMNKLLLQILLYINNDNDEDKAIPVSNVAESQELIKLQSCLFMYKAQLACNNSEDIMQKTRVETLLHSINFKSYFISKFHCELNPIDTILTGINSSKTQISRF